MSALQPHRKRYWLTPPPDDPTELAEEICTACKFYEATPALAAQGAHVMSTDAHDWHSGPFTPAPILTHPARSRRAPGIRIRAAWHGIRLIANLDVASGQVVTPSIGPTRTETDFAAHIIHTIQTDPQAAWIFIDFPAQHEPIRDLGPSAGGAV